MRAGRCRAYGAGAVHSWAAPALVLLLVLTTPSFAADEPPPPALGQQVPAFALFDQERRLYRLESLTEPVIVLNFWAYWCETWKAQLSQLRELARQQEDLDFRLLVVSVDGQWAEVRRKLGPGDPASSWGFPVLLDGQKTLASGLGVRRVPTVMVLDRHRRVRWLHEAYPGNPAVLRAIRQAAGVR